MSATVDRDEVLAFAAEHGAQAAADRFDVSAGTVRSWRARERKIIDHRVREPEPERDLWYQRPEFADAGAEHRGDGLVDVTVPSYSAGQDPATGGFRKAPARARLVERFVLGAEVMSTAPVRDLGCPPDVAATLKAGDIVLLGKLAWADFGDAVWEVVAQAGGWRDAHPYRPTLPRRFDENTGASGAPTADDPDHEADWRRAVVRPARADRPGTTLSADRSRVEPVDLPRSARRSRRTRAGASRVGRRNRRSPVSWRAELGRWRSTPRTRRTERRLLTRHASRPEHAHMQDFRGRGSGAAALDGAAPGGRCRRRRG